MTRKQKRAQRMRRLQHQQQTSQGVRNDPYTTPEGVEMTIAVPRGPRRRDESFHAADKPLMGLKMDAHEATTRALAEIGLYDPSPGVRRQFSRLVKSLGTYGQAKSALAYEMQVQRQKEIAAQTKPDPRNERHFGRRPIGSAVLPQAQPEPEPQGQGQREIVVHDTGRSAQGVLHHPTEQQWEGLVALAKKRKRGIAKFVTSQGFKLAADELDPKNRESWVKEGES